MMASETTADRIARLEMRLADGFQRIGAAMSQGVDVDNWERHWVELLREYERLEDELAAQPEPSPVQGELDLAVERRPVDRLGVGM